MFRILYVYNTINTFIQIDLEILQTRYDVRPAYLPERSLRVFREMWQQTRDVDLVLAWFASWHSLPAFLAAFMRGIPRVLITGGYDVANVPEINYGLRQGGLPYLISEIVFCLTTRAFAFSEASYAETLANTPLTQNNTSLISLGVPNIPAFEQDIPKDDIAITVAVLSKTSATRKGVLEFVRAAQYLPDMRFIVVGKARDDYVNYLLEVAPSNVEFTGFLSDDALIALRQKAKVYVLASHHEGFGLALAESMLARSIPVVTRAGSLPEVVGETGIYIDEISPEKIAAGIRQALNTKEPLAEKARQHILENFSVEDRAQKLIAEIDLVVGEGRQ